MTLTRELIERITKSGPLTVGDYMARCNQHYYGTRDPFGAKGDFTTAPEISQIFGELCGAWIASQWERQGGKQSLLCEAGPGRGTLMKDALRATAKVAGFHDAIEILLIETSPILTGIQQETLPGAHPHITWKEEWEDMPPLPLFFIANEFFDALPVEQHVLMETGWVERRIGHGEKGFMFLPEGQQFIREESPASLAAMQRTAAHIARHGGAALVIDYGYELPEGSGNGPTLQALRAHAYADPLEAPGEADLTAHVNFAALKAVAQTTGAKAHGTVEQGLFLKRLGAELRATALCKGAAPDQRESILSGLERLVAPQAMGELFKVMAVTSSLERPAGF